MGLPAEKIISEALRLPRRIRAIVAECLIESLDFEEPVELSPEWLDEIEKRCREIDEGEVELEDADKVFSKLYADLA